jgi:hypothetical protein
MHSRLLRLAIFFGIHAMFCYLDAIVKRGGLPPVAATLDLDISILAQGDIAAIFCRGLFQNYIDNFAVLPVELSPFQLLVAYLLIGFHNLKGSGFVSVHQNAQRFLVIQQARSSSTKMCNFSTLTRGFTRL